jgi:hypothetical protein
MTLFRVILALVCCSSTCFDIANASNDITKRDSAKTDSAKLKESIIVKQMYVGEKKLASFTVEPTDWAKIKD